jgi:hypothetical protein
MSKWQLWMPGKPEKRVEKIEPLLASWERKEHPAQVKLQSYLDSLASVLGSVLQGRTGLFLHMDIDVQRPERLLHHYDLENYLTPVIHSLGHAHFSFVSATKYVGGGSQLIVGMAQPSREVMEREGWEQFHYRGWNGKDTRSDKNCLRAALAKEVAQPLPPGPVEAHLAWRCSSKRNWVNLWKRTGDVMGPVLGEPANQSGFNPNDDRIVALGLHPNPDEALGFLVDVGMWWRVRTGARA